MSPLTELIGGAKVYGWGNLLQATAFESIASATGTGSSGTITFSSIPSTYKHLQLRFSAIGSFGGSRIHVRLNSDSGANYRDHSLYGDGSSVYAASNTSTWMEVAADGWGISTTYPNVGIVDIHDYASTTKNKVIRTLSGNDRNAANGEVGLYSGLWLNTAAITTVSLLLDTGNFTTDTTVALYGIRG